MELHLRIIGSCLILLGLIHAIFPRQFNWKKELCTLSLVNREMMYIHTFFIAFTLFLVGLLCLTSATELVNTTLGKRVSLGFGIFFLFRLLAQFFGYSSNTWKGKTFETIVHILFSLFWSYITAIFLLIFST